MIAATSKIGIFSCFPFVLIAIAIFVFGVELLRRVKKMRGSNELLKELNSRRK